MLFALFAESSSGGDPARHGTRADVLALLRRQHADLHAALARLPGLSGAAREDEFLQARRHLAVHQAIVDRLFADVGSEQAEQTEHRRLEEEVLVAERLTAASEEFGTAVDRVLRRLLRQGEWVRDPRPDESLPLTREERAVAATGEALWFGEGDAYLGNDYREMLAAARSQLAESAADALARGA